MAQVRRSETGYGIDQEESRMAGRIHGLANIRYPAGGARRGLVVHDHDGLDRVHPVLRQHGLDAFRLRAAAPVPGQEFDLYSPAARHFAP
jgi:hypothetical protein